MSQSKLFDPYQLLFPLGLIHALVGSAIWGFYALNWINYPGQRHTHHMMTGFLLSFATGFLFTAIPRFTGTKQCSLVELSIAASISIISLIFVHPVFALMQLFFIVIFVSRRMSSRTFNPPPYFIFLPVGMMLGILGTALLLFIRWEWINSNFFSAAKLFLYYGMMLSFLLGIGAKLISALLGWAPPPNQRIQITKNRGLDGAQIILPATQAILFTLSFIIESVGYVDLGRMARAICVTWIAIQHWRIYRYPKIPGNASFWIFISAWMLIVGLWTHALFPQLDIHAAHLIFVGGFGLMTIMVASRVTLAHGGYSLDIETKSKIFHVVGLLIMIAMVTRVTAPWMKTYISHLAYAAIAWILAILSWGVFFMPKIVFRNGGILHTHHDPKMSKENNC